MPVATCKIKRYDPDLHYSRRIIPHSVGGTLIGTWLGRLLERTNETRKWRRDRCLEAYADVLKSCQSIVFEAEKNYREFECGTLEHANQGKLVYEKIVEMDRAVDKAILLGSTEVQTSVSRLAKHCGEEIGTKCSLCPRLTTEKWHKIRVTDYAAIYSQFRRAARNDLGLFAKGYTIEKFKV